MKRSAILSFALLTTACVRPAQPPLADPSHAASTERPAEDREWSDRQIWQDVESSVRSAYGDAAFERARYAEAWIMSKLYRGLPMPPTLQPDGTWKEAPHPVALVIREKGQWLRAGATGYSPDAAAQSEIETLLESPAFWAERARIPQGGCTDGGSTLFLIRLPGKQPQVRQGTCGGPPLHSRLISAVYQ
jgi:hypothetical protein